MCLLKEVVPITFYCAASLICHVTCPNVSQHSVGSTSTM